MVNKIKDFVKEQAQQLSEQAARAREDRVKAVRAATTRTAERIKSLNEPIRAVSRSGVKLTAISQSTAEQLIRLQEQLVTTALNDAASQLERAARADRVQDLVRDQADVLRATRERIVGDITAAVTILREAGGDVGKVAKQTYEHVSGRAQPKPARATRKTARKSKAKRAPRKSPARKK